MTPRLAVTREQAEAFYVVDRGQASRSWSLRRGPVTLRLPERPTMPCPGCEASGSWWLCDLECQEGTWPIPEGARVRIEYPCNVCDGTGRGSLDGRPQDWLMCGECNGKGWHPVAFATLTEVHAALADGQPYRWYVTLSDIKPVEADHDEPI